MKLTYRSVIISLFGAGVLFGQESPKNPGTSGPRLVVRNRTLHPIDARLFGQFLERPSWDGETGVEAAVIPGTNRLQPQAVELLRGLNASIIRFPHGTDGDFTNWTDMIDNLPDRAPGRPLTVGHLGDKVTNAFGYDEFLRLCEDFETEPVIVLNFLDGLSGKKPLAEAAQHAAGLVAYCNSRDGAKLPAGLERWPKLRARNGRAQPYKVRYFEIGNEMWSHVRELQERHPRDYIQRYVGCLKAYVQAIRGVDPAVQLLTDSQGPKVDMAVRRDLGNEINFLVVHYYTPGPMQNVLKNGQRTEPSNCSLREWWNAYVAAGPVDPKTGLSTFPLPSPADARIHGYPVAVTEWNWNGWWTDPKLLPPPDLPLARGVGAAGLLHGLMRAGDVVKLACQSNAIGKSWGICAIRVDPEGQMEPYYLPSGQVVALYAQYHGNALLETALERVPVFSQPLQFGAATSSLKVAAVDTLATVGREAIFLHLINRDFDRSFDLEVDLTDFKNLTGTGTIYTLTGRLNVEPGPGETSQVAQLKDSTVRLEGTVLRLKLAAQTVSCVKLDKKP